MSHKSPSVFVDFIAERIIATQMDLLRLLNDGGVNGGVNGGVRSKSGGVNLEELIYDATPDFFRNKRTVRCFP